jgi:hypothetical protein
MKFASHLKQICKRPFNQARVQHERLRTEPVIDFRNQGEYAAVGPLAGPWSLRDPNAATAAIPRRLARYRPSTALDRSPNIER